VNMRMCSFQLTVILFSHFSQHFPQLTITCTTHHITYQINYVIIELYYRRIQQRKNILNNNMHGNMETGRRGHAATSNDHFTDLWLQFKFTVQLYVF
jgi:hypothetical protein